MIMLIPFQAMQATVWRFHILYPNHLRCTESPGDRGSIIISSTPMAKWRDTAQCACAGHVTLLRHGTWQILMTRVMAVFYGLAGLRGRERRGKVGRKGRVRVGESCFVGL